MTTLPHLSRTARLAALPLALFALACGGDDGPTSAEICVDGTMPPCADGPDGGDDGVGPLVLLYASQGEGGRRTGRGGLFLMDEDGRGKEKIAGTSDAWAGDFSPDGRRIAYWERIDVNTANVVVHDVDSGDRSIVHAWDEPDVLEGVLGPPSWSPDGETILFPVRRSTSECPQVEADFYVVGADGSGLRKVLDNGCGSRDRKPTFSPDGSRIAFMSARARPGNTADLFLAEADGSNVRRLTENTGGAVSPTWSPDGTEIAFGRLFGGAELWTVDVDSGELTMLLTLDGDAGQITPGGWSPDGTKIYVTVWWQGAGSDIHVFDAESGNLTRLTTQFEVIDSEVRRKMVDDG